MWATIAHVRVAAAAAARSKTMLSERERQVLDGYARNLDTEEIAARLGIRTSTVFVVVRMPRPNWGLPLPGLSVPGPIHAASSMGARSGNWLNGMTGMP